MTQKRRPAKRLDLPRLSVCGGAVAPYAARLVRKGAKPDPDAGRELSADEVLQDFPPTSPPTRRRRGRRG